MVLWQRSLLPGECLFALVERELGGRLFGKAELKWLAASEWCIHGPAFISRKYDYYSCGEI